MVKKLWSALVAGVVALSFSAAALAQPLPPTPQPGPGPRVTAKKPGTKAPKKAQPGKKSQRKKHGKRRSTAPRAQ